MILLQAICGAILLYLALTLVYVLTVKVPSIIAGMIRGLLKVRKNNKLYAQSQVS